MDRVVRRHPPALAADGLLLDLVKDVYDRRFAEEASLLASAHKREANRLSRELLVQRLRGEEALLASAHRREVARLRKRL